MARHVIPNEENLDEYVMTASTENAAGKRHGKEISSRHFARAVLEPPDAIFGLTVAFREDPSDRKLNLGVGAYRTEDGKPWVLSCVQKAEEMILAEQRRGTLNKEYLPIDGHPALRRLSADLIFGQARLTALGERVQNIQTVSGTGALRLGCEYIRKFMGAEGQDPPDVFVPDPTWANHAKIISHAGLQMKRYRYLNRSTSDLDIEGFIEDLTTAPDGSVFLLHACAHNPTGVDPTPSNWKAIADVFVQKGHFAFFDSAYQGFASGDLDRDAWSVRHFLDKEIPLFVAQSYSKNFGLYAERVGCLQIVGLTDDQSKAAQSMISGLARGMYSNPPIHGALIVSTVLGDWRLSQLWYDELRLMAARIADMRQLLFHGLRDRAVPGNWSHIISQIGMFSYTGLSSDQVKHLTAEHHIYLTADGRISMAGLSRNTISWLADAIKDAVDKFPGQSAAEGAVVKK